MKCATSSPLCCVVWNHSNPSSDRSLNKAYETTSKEVNNEHNGMVQGGFVFKAQYIAIISTFSQLLKPAGCAYRAQSRQSTSKTEDTEPFDKTQ